MSGTVYWITGLSGAGKTTVGKILYGKLKQKKENVALLDGDALRQAIASDLGYSQTERHESARRNAGLCKLLADQGLDVVCCTICMFEEIRQWNRANNEKYFEVYLKVPLEVLKKRNQKNLYEEAPDELVGLGVGMEEPKHPDFVVINDGSKAPGEIAEE
ncbi:hypothetical protein NZ47_09325, partial [Anaerovibrio lipolyticus]